MKRHRISIFVISLLLTAALHAGNGDDIIKIKLLTETETLVPGSSTRLAIQLTIGSPWHINSNPPSGEFQIPTVVTIADSSGIKSGEIVYPTGKMRTFAFSDEAISVYEKTVYAFTTIKLPENYDAAIADISGALQYQACDDEICLPPKTISFTKSMKVGKKGKAQQKQHEDIFKKLDK